jgi:hypothetical protein
VLGYTATAVGVAALGLAFTGTAHADDFGGIGKVLGNDDNDHHGYNGYHRPYQDDEYPYGDRDDDDDPENNGIAGVDTAKIDGGEIAGLDDGLGNIGLFNTKHHGGITNRSSSHNPLGKDLRTDDDPIIPVIGGSFFEGLPVVGSKDDYHYDGDSPLGGNGLDSLGTSGPSAKSIGAKSYRPSASPRTVSSQNFRADLFDPGDITDDLDKASDDFGDNLADQFGVGKDSKYGYKQFADRKIDRYTEDAEDTDDAGDHDFSKPQNILSHMAVGPDAKAGTDDEPARIGDDDSDDDG